MLVLFSQLILKLNFDLNLIIFIFKERFQLVQVWHYISISLTMVKVEVNIIGCIFQIFSFWVEGVASLIIGILGLLGNAFSSSSNAGVSSTILP